jgi:hypothetical protein
MHIQKVISRKTEKKCHGSTTLEYCIIFFYLALLAIVDGMFVVQGYEAPGTILFLKDSNQNKLTE